MRRRILKRRVRPETLGKVRVRKEQLAKGHGVRGAVCQRQRSGIASEAAIRNQRPYEFPPESRQRHGYRSVAYVIVRGCDEVDIGKLEGIQLVQNLAESSQGS